MDLEQTGSRSPRASYARRESCECRVVLANNAAEAGVKTVVVADALTREACV